MKNALPYTIGATKVVSELAVTIVKMARGEVPPMPMGPKTRFDQPVGPHRALEAAEFSLPERKAVRAAINDVCVTICSGGLRRYLQHHNELPDKSLVVNMRKRGSVSKENNVIASMMTYMHTDVADPVERLRRIHDGIAESKKLIGTPLSQPFKIGGLLPPFMIQPISRLYSEGELTRFLPAGTPAVVTNVPGPQMDLYANGARLVKMYLLGMLTPGVGLFHAIFSMNELLTITVLADRDQMPDPQFYRQCLERSYAERRDAVLGSPGR